MASRLAGWAMWSVGVVLLAIPLSGCSGLEKAISGMEKPKVGVQGAKLADLTADGVSLVFDVKIDNPYSVDLPLANVDYALAAKSTQFLSGEAPLSGSIPAKGSRVVQIPANVKFNDIINAVSGIRLGQVVPYKADLGLSMDAPAGGKIRLPVSHSGELPVPNVPDIELAGVEWGKVSLESAEATIKLRLKNTNEFPINLNKMGYSLAMEEHDLFNGNLAKSVALKGGETGEIAIPVKASAAQAGLALLNMVRKSSASYSIKGTTDVTTPFGPLTLPFERSGSASMTR